MSKTVTLQLGCHQINVENKQYGCGI